MAMGFKERFFEEVWKYLHLHHFSLRDFKDSQMLQSKHLVLVFIALFNLAFIYFVIYTYIVCLNNFIFTDRQKWLATTKWPKYNPRQLYSPSTMHEEFHWDRDDRQNIKRVNLTKITCIIESPWQKTGRISLKKTQTIELQIE